MYVQETGVCRREDRYLQNCLVTGEAVNVYFTEEVMAALKYTVTDLLHKISE